MSRRKIIFSATALIAISILTGIRLFAEIQPVVERPMSARPLPPGVAQPVQPATDSLDKILAWNKTIIETEIEAGAMVAKFNFSLTNISPEAVMLTSVGTSCGCTTARMPPLPKAVNPGESLDFEVDMNISGKHGQVTKTVTLTTDKGNQQLIVVSNIKPVMNGMTADDRRGNMEMAIADRQAVFRDDCARCHVAPTRNKTGKELYAAACGICHDAEHRATMVPDLHNLAVETSPAFWSTWITYGKPNTLMPAFAQSQGGFLTSEQIISLVDYLVEAIPPKPVQASVQKVN